MPVDGRTPRDRAKIHCSMLLASVTASRRKLMAAAFLGCAFPAARSQELPLRITSTDTEGELKGTVQAVSPYPFTAVRDALAQPQVWCEILMLHLNNKSCRIDSGSDQPTIALAIARKHDQSAQQANSLLLNWREQENSSNRLVVRLDAAEGPFGTTDYQVVLSATPAGPGKTSISLSYSCRFGRAARLALRTYLSTLGRDKVGFTMVSTRSGRELVGGLRGVIERTAVRYYLAIESWLEAAAFPPAQRPMARLEKWFDATERYPRQLHELEKAEYLTNKRRELGLAP